MKPLPRTPKRDLDRAVAAVRSDEPSSDQIAASRSRLAERLFGQNSLAPEEAAAIRDCSGIEALLPAYRRGSLSAARALLIRGHLMECHGCRMVYERRGALRLATSPWKRSAMGTAAPSRGGRRALSLLAAAVALCVGLWVMQADLFAPRADLVATVQSVSGMLYRIDPVGTDRLTPGATLREGQLVRGGDTPQSLLRLNDGSTIELGERAEFSLDSRHHDTTLHLKRGQIIVKAAQRAAGNLYVTTRDCSVAVTGTVSSVMTDLKGSRVSVIAGKAQFARDAGAGRTLSRGEQATTSPTLESVPIEHEVAWSRNLDEHLALLRELRELGKEWRNLPAPALRREGRLLDWVPEDAALYATLPNYGDRLAEGYGLFKTKLGHSPVLRQWWQSNPMARSEARLDSWFATLRDLSSYLGDELVLTVSREGDPEVMTALAEVRRPGIRDALDSALALLDVDRLPLTVVDEQELDTLDPDAARSGAVLLVTPRVVAISTSPLVLTELAARLTSGAPSAFATMQLGQRVKAAYDRGVDVLVAADLERLAPAPSLGDPANDVDAMPHYLELEHKDLAGHSVNSGVLTFSDPNSGVAAWLAKPAPMGSLDFISPQASAVAAFVVRQPTAVLGEILRRLPNSADAFVRLSELEDVLDARTREELGEALGSELALALDGPMLPVPAWKVVSEVQDPARMERAIESWVARLDRQMRASNAGALVLEHEPLGTRTAHRLRWIDGKFPLEIDYAFVDGYLVATPSRLLLTRAIETRQTGASITQSPRFVALLPRDGRAVFSGLVFQDLVSALAQAAGGSAVGPSSSRQQTLDGLARDSRPSLIALYAQTDHIQVTGTGDLLPFTPEALALPAVIRHIVPESFDAERP